MHRADSRTAVQWIRVLLLSLAIVNAVPAAAQFSGAIHTTLPDGKTENIYTSKDQVYFTGGSQNDRANGLRDGRYYFQVTDPSGAKLLSNDPAKCRQVVVREGRIAGVYDPVTGRVEPPSTPLDATNCEHASQGHEAEKRHEDDDRHEDEERRRSDEEDVQVQVGGAFQACTAGASPDIFCDTPNPGGEYKLWLVAQSSAIRDCNPSVNPDQTSLTFERKCAKTHNFKIKHQAIAHVTVCKFNDANGDGLLSSGELPISGWPITATVPSSSNVTVRSDNQAGPSVTAKTDSTGCVSFAVSGIPDDKHGDDKDVEDKHGDDDRAHDKHVHDKHVTVTLTEGSEAGWTQTAPANGVYDASGHPAASGPTTVSGAHPATGLPAEGGIISVNLGPGDTVTAPSFGNTSPQCPDCSIIGTVTVIKTATPNKLYAWGVTKSVDKTEIDTTTGSGATFNYTVNVTHDAGTGSLLTGTITLINGDGSNPSVTLDLIDAVNNGGVCTIQDPNSGLYVSQVMNLTLNSFTQASLPYRCSYATAPSPSAGTNTATATNASNASTHYIGTATFDFGKAASVADGNVTVIDTMGGALGTVSNTDPSPKTFTYSHTFTGDPTGTCTTHNNTVSATTNTTDTTATASQSVKVCVTGASAAIATTPSPTSVKLGITPITLKDSAVLTGGVNPSGTITFTLVFNGATVETETVTVSGDGTYTTPTGFTLPIAHSSVGTYQWNATYSGDAHNSSASEINAPSEQVVVSAAPQPTIVTTPSPASVSLGTTPITLKDSAALSGGANPTGTITFTLVLNGATVDTETVTVNGAGTYNTPTGFTLPIARTSAGTYQWNATYSGDSNNSPSSETNAASEQVVVSAPSQPAIATTPNPTTGTLGTTPITLRDSAVLTGGLNPSGTITFTLIFNGATVDTETVTVNGAGTYNTPTGFTLPIARSSAGIYQWNAAYSGDAQNNAVSETNAASEQVAVSAPGQPAIATTPNPTSVALTTTAVTLKDSAVLTGGLNPTGTITFTLIFNGAAVDTETVAVSGAGTYNTPTGFTLPIARSSAGTYQWNATYSGDAQNSTVSETNNNSEQVVVSAPPLTAIATTPSPTSATLGSTPITLKDSAVLSGGANQTGTITFTLIFNGATVDTETVTVNGAGTYNTPTGFTLPIARTSAGTYQWNAAYSGDALNNAVNESNAASEQVVVTAPPQPAIATTPNLTSATLVTTPITLKDSAALTGGLNPTGTITFTLIFNGATIDTETVTVNGAGTYSTPTGFTLPIARSSAGTYQWNAAYSGDSNNNATSETNAASEQVVVSAPPPTAIVTTPSPTTATLGSTPITLTDSAVLSGGANQTGTITFTLIFNGATVDTETVTVNGAGTYNTPTGFTLPIARTSAGTYQWNAAYSGDALNNAVSETNAASEQVVVSAPPQPAIATTPNLTSAALGTTPITLRDSAALTGGLNPTGTITFTLIFNGATVDTETVTVSGAGTYNTPTGFTLPIARASAGTYQWNATYTGDSNNNAVSETNNNSEQVAVSAPPLTAIATTPSPTSATLGSTLITLRDSAVLSGGANQTGTITFTLSLNGGPVIDTETVTVNGAGTYSTPTGFNLPVERSSAGTYQWNAAYSGDALNNAVSEINAASEQVVISAPPQPSIATTPNLMSATLGSTPITLKDSAVLAGGINATGTITFTLIFNGATVDTETITVTGAGTYTTPTGFTLPIARSSAGTYQWNATYSGDPQNNAVSEIGAASEQVVVSAPPQPSIVTTPSPMSVTLGTTPITLTDSALLSGGLKPTGTIMFTLSSGPFVIDNETVTVNGAGTYTTPTGVTLPTTGTVTGAYQWNATYSGDGANNSASETANPGERVTVAPAAPAIVTTPTPTSANVGNTLKDVAVLSGGYFPTGTITFRLLLAGTPVHAETVTVTGNGTYTTPTGYAVPSGATGTYQWTATYSGDGNNNAVTESGDPNEQVVVGP